MSGDCNDVADLSEVEVDQRALVNMLSRYPGTFDVLRELVQNADDANARSVEIHFQTTEAKKYQPASKPDVSKLNVCKWIVKDDGDGFKERDWERLGEIAAGNEDSTKIGAFGVGFYSVLSISNRPLVRSNGKSLQFLRGEDGMVGAWFLGGNILTIKDQLLKPDKPQVDNSSDFRTSVELELHKPEPLPVLADLARFLVSSVAFLTNINTISIYLDSHRILRIQRHVKPLVNLQIPQHLKPTTPLETLTVESIQHTVQRIAVDAAEWAFASSSASSDTGDILNERRLEELDLIRTLLSAHAALKDCIIAHDLYTAKISINLPPDSKMKKSVESCMKSLPPSFTCKAVYFNSEQWDSLVNSLNSPKAKYLTHFFCGSHGIFPEKDSGRLVIGQSTNQTTGIRLHISGHFLPTMERGAIDLANGQIKVWNEQVLHVGGFLARVIYEEKMNATQSNGHLATQLGLRTMDGFAFGPTVPHGEVSEILQDAFFSCCHDEKSPLPVVSDAGISCASDPLLRQRNKDLSFLKRYRVLHEEVRPCSEIIRRYKIPLFKFGDILREFESGVTQDALKLFFVWWDDVNKNPPANPKQKDAREDFCKSFRSRVVLRSSNGEMIPLRNIKYFTFFQLPDDLSHPRSIYVDVTQRVPTRNAIERFGWTQLPLLDWLGEVCSRVPRLPDSDAGYHILRVLVQFALVEQDMSSRKWSRAAELIEDLKCIPTTDNGLELPAKSYFDVADVCESLPVAQEADFLDIPDTPVATQKSFDFEPVDEKHIHTVLASIRVRAKMTQEVWEDMVGRLERDASEESNYRLLRYLAIVHKGELSDQQNNDLKEKKVFYSENHGRVSAKELLLANEDVRALGLPILALSRDRIASIQEDVEPPGSFAVQRFIESLGIQRYPSLDKIIAQAASDNSEVQSLAFRHFLSHLDTLYCDYKPDNFDKFAFIPTQCGSLACPNEVFASAVWEKLGFKQVSDDLCRDLSRLVIKENPSVDTIIKYLRTPERTLPDRKTAATWFEHLYLHGNLPGSKLRELSTIPFVPVKNPDPASSGSSSTQYICPKDCFIMSAETKPHYRGIFTFVDFDQNGDSFLDLCGAKKSLDASDIVRKIVENPQSYLKALGNNTKLYLDDLRTIASQLDSIPEEDKQAMKKAPMFPAEWKGKVTERLLTAEQVPIRDWESREFSDNVFVAPNDDMLEKMYCEMGSIFLGTYVQHHIVPIPFRAKCIPQFTRDQVIRRIRCFMDQRDKSEKTDVSFYGQGSTNDLQVKACKCLMMHKTFAPLYGVSADIGTTGVVETVPVPTTAGFEFGEADQPHTLWMVTCRGSDPIALRKDIALALCHVLLKTYGPNDILLLASLFKESDKDLEKYYGSEITSEVPSPPDAQVKSKSKTHGFLKKMVHIPRGLTIVGKKTTPRRDCEIRDVGRAIELWGKLDSNDKIPDFSGPCQPHPISPKIQNHKCKQVDARMVKDETLQDEKTGINFYMIEDAQCPSPPQPALEDFAKLISQLARVFGQEKPSAGCYIFWEDADDNLMAFNRDQKYIFLNLAHYDKFFYNTGVERKEVITQWYLIMAHEIAHNVILDHDESHGSLSTRLAVTHFPALRKEFGDILG